MGQAKSRSDHDEARWFLGTSIKFLVSASEGAADTCVVEHLMPRGATAPLHLHRDEDEIFVVLYGTLRLEVAGRTSYLQTGDAALAPKGVPHSYFVESDGARVLTITRGRGFETMLRAMSRPAGGLGLPPQTAPSAEAVAALTESCRSNGIDLVGPPLTDERANHG